MPRTRVRRRCWRRHCAWNAPRGPGGWAGAPRETPSPGRASAGRCCRSDLQYTRVAARSSAGRCPTPLVVPVSIVPRPAVLSNMGAVPEREAADRVGEDEPALVARALRGDRLALGRLLERFTAAVRRVTYAILGDRDEADDAAQDGLLQALGKLRHYDATRPVGPWLLRIVANAAIDRRRRRTVPVAALLPHTPPGHPPLPHTPL